MERNMKRWIKEYIDTPVKKAMPILSFPGAVMMRRTVEELVKDGHLQALCMKEIADQFDTGASFSLMDLSVEAEAFGSPILYTEDEVPTVNGILVKTEEEAVKLKIPMIGEGRTGACVEGIREACRLIIDRPVIAGMIGPFSLVGRLTDMTEIMYLCFDEPDMVKCLLDKAVEFLIQYAAAFKAAGANGICMAEPAAGLLSPMLFDQFSSPYVQKIRDAVEDDSFIIIYHNCGNIRPLMENVKEIHACAYSVGNIISMENALAVLPEDALVMGNIDPAGVIRSGSPNTVYGETAELLRQCGKYKNFVASSGCDIPPMTPVENIQAFFDAVKKFYER